MKNIRTNIYEKRVSYPVILPRLLLHEMLEPLWRIWRYAGSRKFSNILSLIW